MDAILRTICPKCHSGRTASQQNIALKKQISETYGEIRENCSTFRYLCILKMMALLRTKTYQKMADDRSSKIARLLYRDVDVEEHINNISSYNLTFFDKLVLCRGLQFSTPQPCISAIDTQASFEKAYSKLEPMLADEKKELAAATLRSIALNYIERKALKLPKTLVKSIQQLKKREDIISTKPDTDSGVVIMDKFDYIRLLSEASINDRTKFKTFEQQRGRPPKYYHPLLAKEKHLETVVRRILPEVIADSVCQKGSRLAHFYGLPKTDREVLQCNRSYQQLELTITL